MKLADADELRSHEGGQGPFRVGRPMRLLGKVLFILIISQLRLDGL
jgi:hypothetical protein